jgi:hypothetical protein
MNRRSSGIELPKMATLLELLLEKGRLHNV